LLHNSAEKRHLHKAAAKNVAGFGVVTGNGGRATGKIHFETRPVVSDWQLTNFDILGKILPKLKIERER